PFWLCSFTFQVNCDSNFAASSGVSTRLGMLAPRVSVVTDWLLQKPCRSGAPQLVWGGFAIGLAAEVVCANTGEASANAIAASEAARMKRDMNLLPQRICDKNAPRREAREECAEQPGVIAYQLAKRGFPASRPRRNAPSLPVEIRPDPVEV